MSGLPTNGKLTYFRFQGAVNASRSYIQHKICVHLRFKQLVLNFLQPAVEALSEREAQLALRNEIENGNIDDFVDTDFEWNNGE